MAGNLRSVSDIQRRELRGHAIVLLVLSSHKVQCGSSIEDESPKGTCKHEKERRVRHVA